jgi:hypothetical protein
VKAFDLAELRVTLPNLRHPQNPQARTWRLNFFRHFLGT